jgi:glucose/arabinose dehydrogenase
MKAVQAVTAIVLIWLVAVAAAQQGSVADTDRQNPLGPTGSMGVPPVRLPDEPLVFDTAEQHRIRVVVVAKGFLHPWSLAFLPDGNVLVTERAGRLRILRNGTLDPQPIPGVPDVYPKHAYWGLMDVALHPQFAQNKLLYLTYLKPLDGDRFTTALARGRFDGHSLADVRDIFVMTPPGGGGSRIAFGRDGMLYMTIVGAGGENRAQDPNSVAGKVLRLRDDGGIPTDNPFVGRPGYRPEIYTLGHRSNIGIAVHPETGAVWVTEHGPMGGDEINVLLPGRNYGWPLVSYGRTYAGARVSEIPWREGMEQPLLFWMPSIAVTGIAFYTGDRFPAWKGNVFVGGLQTARIARTGHVERIVFNRRGEEQRRESLLLELKKRVRDVRQGPDGLLYALVEDDWAGDSGGETALLRIEPAP